MLHISKTQTLFSKGLNSRLRSYLQSGFLVKYNETDACYDIFCQEGGENFYTEATLDKNGHLEDCYGD